jgi:hypothetical protein
MLMRNNELYNDAYKSQFSSKESDRYAVDNRAISNEQTGGLDLLQIAYITVRVSCKTGYLANHFSSHWQGLTGYLPQKTDEAQVPCPLSIQIDSYLWVSMGPQF